MDIERLGLFGHSRGGGTAILGRGPPGLGPQTRSPGDLVGGQHLRPSRRRNEAGLATEGLDPDGQRPAQARSSFSTGSSSTIWRLTAPISTFWPLPTVAWRPGFWSMERMTKRSPVVEARTLAEDAAGNGGPARDSRGVSHLRCHPSLPRARLPNSSRLSTPPRAGFEKS